MIVILRRNTKNTVLTAAMLLSVLMLVSCGNASDTADFKNIFSIDQDVNIEFTEIYNSYGGFPYEGESLYMAEIDSEASGCFTEWNDTPLSDELYEFFYDELPDMPGTAEKIGLPEINSGKWKFIDRGETDFNEISSCNFSVCIYDSDNSVAYYYKIDT